jgi:manganese-dependent ADP-ribose/CDP-alcohol diphosphatase
MSAAAFVLGTRTASEAKAEANEESFQFGLVADPQYCDCPNRGTRYYRASLGKLEETARTFNGQDLAFTVQLGDIIDRHVESFSEILPIYEKAKGPKFHVLGNHDFPVTTEEVVEILGMPNQYYEFRREGWRFVVLDTNDISLYANPEGSEKYELAEEMYAELKQSGAVNAQTWNGAVGEEQMEWLRGVLAGARRRDEKVIIFSHMPVYPKNVHNAWNDDALVETFESYGNTVAAYFNGHNHYGNYGEKDGIHYVNFHGMVELDTNAYSTVRVHPDRLEIDGYGREPDRVLKFVGNAAETGKTNTQREKTEVGP